MRLLVFVLLSFSVFALRAGVSKVDSTLPIGVPLAGFNHGDRRVPYWPLPEPKEYTFWMTPSVGVMAPLWVKALVIDNDEERVAFVTLDGIGSDGTLNELAYKIAQAQGFNVPFENCIFGASHSHSGPGAVSAQRLWEVAPATDLIVKDLQIQLATLLAAAMVEAELSLGPAALDMGMAYLVNVTRNRRGHISPVCNVNTIDPNLGIIRVDHLDGSPLATVWNYAIHGTCYGPSNMLQSNDIAGHTCEKVEELIGGVALFINADAGDVDPTGATCSNAPDFAGSPVFAAAIAEARSTLLPTQTVGIKVAQKIVDFGPTNANLTLARLNNCTVGGPLDICSICEKLDCDANLHLSAEWIENTPRFTALRFDIKGNHHGIVTIPGEAIVEIGWEIRNNTQKMGFTNTFLFGYSNNHMGYITNALEYNVGGYESVLTLWGIGEGAKMVEEISAVAAMVAP